MFLLSYEIESDAIFQNKHGDGQYISGFEIIYNVSYILRY